MFFKGKLNLLFVVALVIALFALTGCFASYGGTIPPEIPDDSMWFLSSASTLRGVADVVTGAVHSGMILQKGGDYIAIVWPIKNMGWASVFIDTNLMKIVDNTDDLASVVGKGAIVSSKSMADYITMMMDSGFEQINPGDVPSAVAAALARNGVIGSLKAAPVIVLPYGILKDASDIDNLITPVEVQQ